MTRGGVRREFCAAYETPADPGYIALQREMEAGGVVIVGISLDRDGPQAVREFAEQSGINCALVMGDNRVMDAFGGVAVMPMTFLIDRDGQIRRRKVGMMPREAYEPLVRSLLY